MKPKITIAFLCRNRQRPDAACRKLTRCARCGQALRFGQRGWLCSDCTHGKKEGGK